MHNINKARFLCRMFESSKITLQFRSFNSRNAGLSVSSDDYIPGKPFLRIMIMIAIFKIASCGMTLNWFITIFIRRLKSLQA